MISGYGSLVLLVLAIYALFMTDGGWPRVIGGLYIGCFFVVSIIAAWQSPEPLLHLVVPGLFVILMVFAYSIGNKWKDWP
jgi:hypothetical protein